MNFALLGDSSAVLPLLQAVAAAETHRLTHAVSSPAMLDAALPQFPGLSVVSGWEEIPESRIDAVVLAGHDKDNLVGAKQLATAGKTLVVFPEAAQGSEWVYELTLLDEEGTTLYPAFAHRLHPAVDALRNAIGDGRLGQLRHLQMQREIQAAEQPAAAQLVNQRDLDDALLHDVDLMRLVGGEYNQVTALLSGRQDTRLATATVTLAGDDVPEAIWTLKPSADPSSWQLRIVGDNGEAVLSGGRGYENIRLSGPAAIQSTDGDTDSGPDVAAILRDLEQTPTAESTHTATWNDLVRAFDVVDGAHRSLRRRRTVELQFESTSERNQFKTQMTAIGCGTLVFTVLAVIALLIVSAVADPRERTEMEAEAAGSIFYASDFVAESPELNDQGERRIAELSERIDRLVSAQSPIVVEQTGTRATPLDERRRSNLVDALDELDVEHADTRTVVAPVEGKAFGTVMRVARIVVWLPLFVFLVLQMLLFVARPASAKQADAATAS